MLTLDRLREVLAYDQTTGVFTWVKPPWNKPYYVGNRAGCVTCRGYRKIGINGRFYEEQRLAWLYVSGSLPEEDQIDHIDCDPLNNRWSNLRQATGSQNTANQRQLKDGKLKGVSFLKKYGKYQAQIKRGGKSIYLGLFDAEQQAHDAYVAKAKELFGEFARAA